MGVMVSSQRAERAAKKRSDAIQRTIQSERRRGRQADILLLGSGGDEIVHHFRRDKLAHKGYSETEIEPYKRAIILNTMEYLKSFLDVSTPLDISLSPESSAWRDIIATQLCPGDSKNISSESIKALHDLWHDPAVQLKFIHRTPNSLDKNTLYYLESIDRITDTVYRPNDDDIIYCRSYNTIDEAFPTEGLVYRFLDGRRIKGNKKKWWPCFDGADIIIYGVDLADYDQVLYENGPNKMEENLRAFEEVCNSRWFLPISIILLLNNSGLSPDKLSSSPLKDYFSDYEEGDDCYAASQYFQKKFVSLNKRRTSRDIYSHFVSADDTKILKGVSYSSEVLFVMDIIQRNMIRVVQCFEY
ncbi:guanine nucleotide binding protein, alpha subunit [Collybia nuda]|uniref:Guanine nucleotide binding protein, alpha subunit n=1 Tax=Collybia nuda TaxID=64659 RepID=A0A9P5Y5W1_9AGAR|nr:guanine nucleotide binding protein, alpha subunit [Collybia nuda]